MPAYGVPYQVPTETVALYQDPNYTVRVPDAQYDKTSNILRNLPIGVVVTLVGGWAPGEDEKRVVVLSHGNTCLDLVGTRTTEVRWKSLGDRQTVTLYDAEEGNGIAYNNSNSQTVTVETSDQHVAGISSTFSQMFSAGAEGIATSSTQWSVSVIHSYTRTDTSSRSQTKIVNLNITLTVNAPPKTRYKATLLVTIGQLPATEYIMTA
ncbi:hypothetical protein BELL_0954g00050 [Botrytis elliptica]|uniref:Uncharacterized protein n=1 Tax=Botrytis elliptica TaxID=278938 RepID=A0A4Z1J4C7_9HELO|nr:hypothetical protein BELL_0954g00050 [Botrytis elliptica]